MLVVRHLRGNLKHNNALILAFTQEKVGQPNNTTQSYMTPIDSMTTSSGVFPPESFQIVFVFSEVRLFDDGQCIETVRFPYPTLLSSLPLLSLVRTPARQQPLASGHDMAGTPSMPRCRAWTQSVSLYTFSPRRSCCTICRRLVESMSFFGNHAEVGRQRECVGNTRSCRAGQEKSL